MSDCYVKVDCYDCSLDNVWERHTKFNNYDDVINFIKENNFTSENLSIKTYSLGVLMLVVDYYIPCIEYKIPRKDHLIVLTYAKRYKHISKVIPKELLEYFSVNQLLEILSLCRGDYAIDPEFKDTKKYMQAELMYKL